jgi:hypothetical protein
MIDSRAVVESLGCCALPSDSHGATATDYLRQTVSQSTGRRLSTHPLTHETGRWHGMAQAT